ncbi:DUF6053 domain-containing protein [Lysobacter sp. TAB13]
MPRRFRDVFAISPATALLWDGNAFVGGPSGPMLFFQIAAT